MSPDEYVVSLTDTIQQFGWAVQGVFGDDSVPFAYTVGLTEKGLPEMVMYALPLDTMTTLLNDTAKLLIAGTVPAAPCDVDGVIKNLPLRLHGPVDAVMASMNMARRLYGEVQALQLLWPDKDGRFPGESSFTFDDHQPLLPIYLEAR